ncbi:MAG: hypothetical protein ABIH20_00475 [Candidatus Diapherotrites archaeon]
MNLVSSFLLAYVLTNLIEFIPLHLILKKNFNEEIIGLLKINTITLPVVWIVLSFFFNEDFFAAFVIVELLVVLTETIFIKRIFRKQFKESLLIASAMNILSAAIGFFLL